MYNVHAINPAALETLRAVLKFPAFAYSAVALVDVFRKLNEPGRCSPPVFAASIATLDAAGFFRWTFGEVNVDGEGIAKAFRGIDRKALNEALNDFDRNGINKGAKE